MQDQDRSGFLIRPIGRVHSPFSEKFGVPRQPGLVDSAVGEVRLLAPYDDPAALDALAEFSHIWLIFRFDRCADSAWQPRVRPPRLGGNRSVGVWASRAPFRPNGLGLSVVRVREIVTRPRPLIRVSGLDILDGTPVFDIKPYIPYADALPDARAGYATEPPAPRLQVTFSAAAEAALDCLSDPTATRRLIVDVLALDPRPAYQREIASERVYGCRLGELNVRWTVTASELLVTAIDSCPPAQED